MAQGCLAGFNTTKAMMNIASATLGWCVVCCSPRFWHFAHHPPEILLADQQSSLLVVVVVYGWWLSLPRELEGPSGCEKSLRELSTVGGNWITYTFQSASPKVSHKRVLAREREHWFLQHFRHS